MTESTMQWLMYNFTLCPLQSRLQHSYHGQTYATESTLTLCQSRLYPPVRDFWFGLCRKQPKKVASGLEDGGKTREESIYSTMWERCKQRGLKYTEHKPVGRHYLGVTRTTNEFRSSHPHTSERDLLNFFVLTPPVASTLFVLRFYGVQMTHWWSSEECKF
jgi:hypothetical protein